MRYSLYHGECTHSTYQTFVEAQAAQYKIYHQGGPLWQIKEDTPLTVGGLIKFLQEQNPNFLVAYRCYSEQMLIELRDIQVKNLCEPRPDGWVQNERPDMSNTPYLLFPGN